MMFILLLLLGVLLRLPNLNKGISGDEGALLFYSAGTIGEVMGKLNQISIFPPLSALPLRAWMQLGASEAWVRLYFVLFGAGSCYLIYLIGREYIDKKFGLTALYICAVSPFLIWTSQYIRSYIDSTFWALLSTLFLLRIVKGKESFVNYLLYSLSCAAAIYTSYFNILILASQLLFMLIFFSRESRKFIKYLAANLVTGLLFLPWFLTAMGQYQNATGIKEFWNLKGFRFGGFYIGRYLRQVAALLGVDPDFLNTGISRSPINGWSLYIICFMVIIAALWLTCLAVRVLTRIHNGNRKFVWFIVILTVFPVILANVAEALFNFRPTPKLFSYSCAVFVFISAALVYSLSTRRKIYYTVLLGLTFACAVRLPAAYQPEMDTKKAYKFLTENVGQNEAILMARNTNYYLGAGSMPIIILKDCLKQDPKTGDYTAFLGSADEVLSNLKNSHRSLWFYKSEGTDDILGANKLILDWLNENGYRAGRIEHLKRIELSNFKRNGA